MSKLFICSECGEEYNPLVTEDDCGLCAKCAEAIVDETLEFDFYDEVLA